LLHFSSQEWDICNEQSFPQNEFSATIYLNEMFSRGFIMMKKVFGTGALMRNEFVPVIFENIYFPLPTKEWKKFSLPDFERRIFSVSTRANKILVIICGHSRKVVPMLN
jgi:hypothetical protein